MLTLTLTCAGVIAFITIPQKSYIFKQLQVFMISSVHSSEATTLLGLVWLLADYSGLH